MSSVPRPASAGNFRDQLAAKGALVGGKHLPSLGFVCAWCGRAIKANAFCTAPDQDKFGAISHGICSVCSAIELTALSA
jgi:hypothetical protein